MKLPFSFGLRFTLRVLVPGLPLALAMWLVFADLVQSPSFTPNVQVHLPLLIILTGLALIFADMPIYMAFEGRRLRPRWLWRQCYLSEQRRLKRLQTMSNVFDEKAKKAKEVADKAKEADYLARRLETNLKIADFPVDTEASNQAPDGPGRIVKFPTRLGNLLDAIEQYPKVNYGLYAVFWWYRVYLLADKDSRDELDERQALADCLLYLAISVLAGGLILTIYGLTATIFGKPVPGKYWPLLFAFPVATLISYGLYRFSIPLHRTWGDHFKAFFDINYPRLEIDRRAEEIAAALGAPELVPGAAADRAMMVWRFLRWHRVRWPGICKSVNARAPKPLVRAAE